MSSDGNLIKFGIGQPVRRFEDLRLLTGSGRYQDDVNLPRQACAVFVRSPHAHAEISRIDTAAAAAGARACSRSTPAADYAADGLGHAEGEDAAQKAPTARRCSRRSGRRWSAIACVMSAIRWRW